MPDTDTQSPGAGAGIVSESVSDWPTIAVVIAARNAEEFLGETLESLSCQSVAPDEVVVYDDASGDSTVDVVRDFEHRFENLCLLQGTDRAGISAARNKANGVVRSDYIAVLDADDLFVPDAICQYRSFLGENRDADLVYADTRVFRKDPGESSLQCYPRFRSVSDGIRRTLASPRLPFKHSSMLYRRTAFEELGGYDEGYRIKVDVELFLRFLAAGKKVAKLDRPVSLHRKHSGQISLRRIEGIRTFGRLIRRFESNPLLRLPLLTTRCGAEVLKLFLRG